LYDQEGPKVGFDKQVTYHRILYTLDFKQSLLAAEDPNYLLTDLPNVIGYLKDSGKTSNSSLIKLLEHIEKSVKDLGELNEPLSVEDKPVVRKRREAQLEQLMTQINDFKQAVPDNEPGNKPNKFDHHLARIKRNTQTTQRNLKEVKLLDVADERFGATAQKCLKTAASVVSLISKYKK